jgi:hypothetical protein
MVTGSCYVVARRLKAMRLIRREIVSYCYDARSRRYLAQTNNHKHERINP